MKRYLGGGIPGIPSAPTANWNVKEVDVYCQKKYKELYKKLPVLTQEEILKQRYPYHSLLFRTLTEEGYHQVVKEINAIVQLEQLHEKGRNLLIEKDKLTLIANTLKECEQLIAMGKRDLGVDFRKTLAEKLIIDYNDVWLAIKFIESCLEVCESVDDSEPRQLYDRVAAEAHCVMACIAYGFPDYFDNATDVILSHLDACRELSDLHRVWQFKRDVASFKIAKPATFQGLRKVYETISSSAMPLYVFATLLLHQVYFNIADNIMEKNENPGMACDWAERALMLAREVRQPTALYTSILRYGRLLLDIGETREALPYFVDLQDRSLVNLDTVTQAVAMNNMGVCYDRERETIKALEQFTKQLELSQENNLLDTAGAAHYEMGKILLSEGQLWEAEECYQRSHEQLNTSEELDPDSDLVDETWAMIGITAGHNLWSRFASLCRSKEPEDIYRVIQWKSRRQPLPLVGHPDYEPDLISEFYNPDMFYNPENAPKKRDKKEEKKVTFKGNPGDSKKKLMSSYREMLYQDDNFEFASDARTDKFLNYRQLSMYRAMHWARSLTVAMAQRSTEMNANVNRGVVHSGRQAFVDKHAVKDVQFFDYD